MDDALDITEADDTFDDDCTCDENCDHEYHVVDGEAEFPCDPMCPVHGGRG